MVQPSEDSFYSLNEVGIFWTEDWGCLECLFYFSPLRSQTPRLQQCHCPLSTLGKVILRLQTRAPGFKRFSTSNSVPSNEQQCLDCRDCSQIKSWCCYLSLFVACWQLTPSLIIILKLLRKTEKSCITAVIKCLSRSELQSRNLHECSCTDRHQRQIYLLSGSGEVAPLITITNK